MSILSCFLRLHVTFVEANLSWMMLYQNHKYFLLYEENITFEISARRNVLSISPANKILIMHPWWKISESHQPSIKVKFSPSHCSNVVPFSLSLVEERGKVLSNWNWSVDHESLVYEHLLWWLNTFLRIKEELEGTGINLHKTKSINSHVLDITRIIRELWKIRCYWSFRVYGNF